MCSFSYVRTLSPLFSISVRNSVLLWVCLPGIFMVKWVHTSATTEGRKEEEEEDIGKVRELVKHFLLNCTDSPLNILPLPKCTYLFQLRKYLLRSLKVEEKKNNILVNFYKQLLYSTYIELIYFVNIFLNVTQNMQITNKKVKLGFRQQQHSKALKKKGRVNKSLGKMWKPPTESIQIKNHLSEVKCSREKCFLPDKKKG